MGLFLLLGVAALLYYANSKPQSGVGVALSPVLQLFSPTNNWPKQTVAAMQVNKHYFFSLPLVGDLKANAQLAQVNVALALMGWKNVKLFPTGADLATADSPYPHDWASDPGLRVSGTWTGSPGQTFNLDQMRPLGAASVIMWMPTEDFVSMHATKA